MIHKEFICHLFSFFRSATDGTWAEARTGVVDLPDDDPKIFEIFEHWLYTSILRINIPNYFTEDDEHEDEDKQEDELDDDSYDSDEDLSNSESGEAMLHRLAQIVLFADKFGAPDLCNAAIDAMKQAWDNNAGLTTTTVRLIYQNTTDTASIRRLVIHMIAHEMTESGVKNVIRKLETLPFPFVSALVYAFYRRIANEPSEDRFLDVQKCTLQNHPDETCELISKAYEEGATWTT